MCSLAQALKIQWCSEFWYSKFWCSNFSCSNFDALISGTFSLSLSTTVSKENYFCHWNSKRIAKLAFYRTNDTEQMVYCFIARKNWNKIWQFWEKWLIFIKKFPNDSPKYKEKWQKKLCQIEKKLCQIKIIMPDVFFLCQMTQNYARSGMHYAKLRPLHETHVANWCYNYVYLEALVRWDPFDIANFPLPGSFKCGKSGASWRCDLHCDLCIINIWRRFSLASRRGITFLFGIS